MGIRWKAVANGKSMTRIGRKESTNGELAVCAGRADGDGHLPFAILCKSELSQGHKNIQQGFEYLSMLKTLGIELAI